MELARMTQLVKDAKEELSQNPAPTDGPEETYRRIVRNVLTEAGWDEPETQPPRNPKAT